MNACIGRDFIGASATSHARVLLSSSYDFADSAACFDGPFDDDDEDLENPGGGGRFFHLDEDSKDEYSRIVCMVVMNW